MHKIRVAARHTRLAWSEPAVHQGFHGKLLIPNKIVDCFFCRQFKQILDLQGFPGGKNNLSTKLSTKALDMSTCDFKSST